MFKAGRGLVFRKGGNIMRRREIAIILSVVMAFSVCLSGCSSKKSSNSSSSSVTAQASSGIVETEAKSYDISDATTISFGDDIEIDGEGAESSDNKVSITKAGIYVLEGESDDASIEVECSKEEDVILVLKDVSLQSKTGPVINCIQSNKLIINLYEGTKNSLSDSSDYSDEAVENDLTAAVYSKDDLTINGAGELTVTGNYKDAVSTKDDLNIKSGTISITAADDALVGKESIEITGGTIDIKAENDAIKSTEYQDTEKGFITIENTKLTINAGDDAIHSELNITINSGDISIESCEEGMESQNITINNGIINIVAKDDAVNITEAGTTSSEESFGGGFGGGHFRENSDNNSSDTDNKDNTQQNSGNTDTQDNTQKSSDEGSGDMDNPPQRPDGENSDMGTPPQRPDGENSDMGTPPQRPDGENSDMGTPPQRPDEANANTDDSTQNQDESSTDSKTGSENTRKDWFEKGQKDGSNFGGRGGMMENAIDGTLTINNGIITIDAGGDGLDSNGNLIVNNGIITVSGSENGGNSAIDVAGTVELNGGELYVSGNQGMAESPGSTSLSYIEVRGTSFSAGDTIKVTDKKGNEVYSFKAAKSGDYILVAGEDIESDTTYTVKIGSEEVEAQS